MKRYPYCAESIQAEAIKCRWCGEFLDGRQQGAAAAVAGGRRPVVVAAPAFWGYEYRSKTTLFGLPLVHVAQGVDPVTRRPRIARGIFALGNIAVGVFALGGIALGGLTFGGMSLGLLAIGGIAVGGGALGGMAFGALVAVGGMAVSLGFALGGMALAPYTVGETLGALLGGAGADGAPR